MNESMTALPIKQSSLKRLADPGILFYLLPYLMILLIAGTVAQKDLGIFEAQRIFFSSWVIWFGPFPLPGAYPTLGLLTICLAIKFILYSPWRFDRAGTIITHLGILVLLGGGILTALTQKEGYLSLREGQSSASVADYHARVLRIEKEDAFFAAVPFEKLKRGEPITGLDIPFELSAIKTCVNCRPEGVDDTEGRHGLAQQIDLTDAPPALENETNLSGAVIKVTGADDAQDGIYVTMEEIPHQIKIEKDDATYTMTMRRAERVLPFEVELVTFKQDNYPGMMMARGFASDVIVHDNGIDWPARISMNEPLRYKGYTLYQSSFAQKPDGTYSVFSVVQNKGRAFPYIASFLIFAGLLIHCLLRLPKRRKGLLA